MATKYTSEKITLPGDHGGTYLKALRLVFGEKITDQARRLGAQPSDISTWEKGGGSPPDCAVLRASYGLPPTALPSIRSLMTRSIPRVGTGSEVSDGE